MTGRWNVLTPALCLSLIMALSEASCPNGFFFKKRKCLDVNECEVDDGSPEPCGENTKCFNTIGSFYCQCVDGFRSSMTFNFSADSSAVCQDINECWENKDICGPNARCINTSPYFTCKCFDGFISSSVMSGLDGKNDTCKDGNRTFQRETSGHNCTCPTGFTNYGIDGFRCTKLECDVFKDMNSLTEISNCQRSHGAVAKTARSLVRECPAQLNGENLLKTLLSMIDKLLSSRALNDNREVSIFLDIIENALKHIGPYMQTPGQNTSSNYAELMWLVHKGINLPKGPVTLTSRNAQLDIQLETAAGDPSSYPGFTTVSLMSYANLEESANGYFGQMKQQNNESFQINSKIVTVTVSNPKTSHLREPVNLTFNHLEQSNENPTCVFWNSSENEGAWSRQGCTVVESTPDYTVCSCTHLSSFAVLMALYEIEKFELQLISWVGASLSIICLFICILTFLLIRSIQSPRTTIHLHLCISLFIAMFIFLAGISRTENPVGCAVVAGLLHFFFLAAFCWMCLEGIQLYRMVVLVFNTNFKTLYMMGAGYGVPAVIVAISASVNPQGYGTKRYCWLNLNSIWSFFGPVCFIITANIFFFLITVWKLAEKFSSLNPDLDNLRKIKAFIITAVAQLCVLGIMWIFGCFQFEEHTIVMSYLFTIFGCLQGVLLFVMHCLFSKQVREEYINILSRFCAPQKKAYKEFGLSHSSKAHANKSSQDTGESHI